MFIGLSLNILLYFGGFVVKMPASVFTHVIDLLIVHGEHLKVKFKWAIVYQVIKVLYIL